MFRVLCQGYVTRVISADRAGPSTNLTHPLQTVLQYIDHERHLRFTANGPVFTENPYTREVERVRYNAADRSPLAADSMDMAQMRQVYKYAARSSICC
jgi:hypothetical protein